MTSHDSGDFSVSEAHALEVFKYRLLHVDQAGLVHLGSINTTVSEPDVWAAGELNGADGRELDKVSEGEVGGDMVTIFFDFLNLVESPFETVVLWTLRLTVLMED